MPHGGPFARDSWAFDPEVQFLASRGYAVLQPNFRGSTGYGRDFVERGYGQLGTGMIDDLDDGVDWLAGQGIADPARVCIMGASYGGYAAMWARDPQPRPLSLRDQLRRARPTSARCCATIAAAVRRRPAMSRDWRRRVDGEERHRPRRRLAAARMPERLRVPLLIAHGEQRPRRAGRQSRDLVARARSGASAPRSKSVFYPEGRPRLHRRRRGLGRFPAPRRSLPRPPQSGRRATPRPRPAQRRGRARPRLSISAASR